MYDWEDLVDSIESLETPVFAIDSDGRVIAWNRAIEQLTGVRRGETRVREFLRQTMGLRWRKVAAVPVPPKQTLAEHAAHQADFLKDGA